MRKRKLMAHRNSCLVGCSFAVALVTATATHDAAHAAVRQAPSLSLIAAEHTVQVGVHDVRSPTQLGLWIVPVGGGFSIRARRPQYSSWEAVQVDPASGAALRVIPSQLISESGALSGLLDVRYSTRGRDVTRERLDFCPEFIERANGDGPWAPRLPSGFCGGSVPFVAGTLWGIDAGWAAAAGGGEGATLLSRLKPGRYRVTARISEPFRRLLAVPHSRSVARLTLHVSRRSSEDRSPSAPFRPSGTTLPAISHNGFDPSALAPPDLVALPPWDIGTRHVRGRDLMTFAGTPWNAGPGPLVVEGFRQPNTRLMDARQYILNRTGEVAEGVPAGHMEFHERPGHNHWHFLQFVNYRLLRQSQEAAVSSRKQSFCLAATDAIDVTVPGATLPPDAIGLAQSACGDAHSIWLRQTLPAGWGDTYHADIAGQDLDITAVPNDKYHLEMRVNPLAELREVTTSNNSAMRVVILSGRKGSRRAKVLPWHGING